ncbi:efflux RND transporter periplasmic adaptor subunit [Candidatus Berkiella aquae]|uniref:Efflux RND transporter periplasmic adaptor subunit n=1 Tax=Candidatus Berkiella aquae TaxID=295108 RepID=A0A0Q9YLY7_9GAMM|nr:efflux RND transporter periplasmic adaptor subunit [Candidatus Berkiella aquae]MCS5710506.1 efflux RND transporter periplasmic adaptor subunit [Candidatus Berkiella aquae]
MDLLLILTYTAICIFIFKIFRIPLNKWTVPTAVLGGVVIVGALIFGMNYNHPYSEMSLEYFVTTPIIPNVNGQVIEVPVKINAPLKAGETLLKIDPEPFKHKCDSLKAQLKMAQSDLDRAVELVAKKALPERELEVAHSRKDQLTADLAIANYELSQTTIKAPSVGFVTQVAVRPGMRAVAMPLRPLMIFVPIESKHFIGWFRQNSLLRLKPGDKAEVIFDGIPGTIFTGNVKYVFNVLAEGQISPNGELIDSKKAKDPGRVAVRIEITDPAFEKYRNALPGGSYGQAAIYTQHAKHLSIIRKVLIRMAAWMNYLFPIH